MKRLLILAGLTLLMNACEDEKPPAPPSPSPSDTIAKVWTIKDAKENGTTTSDFNGNTITFAKNGTYKAVSPFETVNGIWQFNAAQTHVIFDNNSKPAELLSDWEILELNNRRFRWKWTHGQETVEATMEP